MGASEVGIVASARIVKEAARRRPSMTLIQFLGQIVFRVAVPSKLAYIGQGISGLLLNSGLPKSC